MTAPFQSFPWPYSFWFDKIGAVDVARTSEEEKKYPASNTRKQAVGQMIEKLTKLKKTMLIFPEGHLEKIHHPRPYHTGAVRIAMEAGVPLVPVTMRGNERVFSPNRWLLRSGTIHVVFHEPMPLPDKTNLADHDLIRILTQQLLCRISSGLPINYFTPGMVTACREVLAMHPLTRGSLANQENGKQKTVAGPRGPLARRVKSTKKKSSNSKQF